MQMQVKIVLRKRDSGEQRIETVSTPSEHRVWMDLSKHISDGWEITMIETLPEEPEKAAKDD